MIGDTLKRLRNIYGYKAIELSLLLEISNTYLSEIERNHKTPSIDLLQKYASTFNIKLSSLISIMEAYDSEVKNNRTQEQITWMMIALINSMGKENVNEKTI